MRGKNFKQGIYQVKNPEKYIGDLQRVVYRSSWELRVMTIFDLSKNVLRWGSETFIIPYFSPLDNKWHKYYIDFWVEFLSNKGCVEKYLIEVKPKSETLKPIISGRITEKKKNNYVLAMQTYIVNTRKWIAAEEFCKKGGIKFLILTEDKLNLLK